METNGATVVISHHIREGRDHDYERWLNEIGPLCRNARGLIDWQIIRPIQGLTYLYTVIIRFDTISNLKHWMQSDDRKQLIEKIRPLLAKDDNYYIKTGLDFLFTSENSTMKPPVRWKQFLVTWSAIYPLSIVIPIILLPILKRLGFPSIRLVDSLFISCAVVALMVYVIMPNYTKWIKKWLYQ